LILELFQECFAAPIKWFRAGLEGNPCGNCLLSLHLPKRRRSIVSPGFVQKTSRVQIVLLVKATAVGTTRNNDRDKTNCYEKPDHGSNIFP
jgi:hypothetical protein